MARKFAAPPAAASLPLADAALEMVAARFRALAEPVRLRILSTLMQGERTVGQLVEASATGQANVSKHLAILRDAGMVSTRREGVTTVCSIADPAIHQLCDLMCKRLRAEMEAKAQALEATQA
jgi:ArsR family transcriptional regulator